MQSQFISGDISIMRIGIGDIEDIVQFFVGQGIFPGVALVPVHIHPENTLAPRFCSDRLSIKKIPFLGRKEKISSLVPDQKISFRPSLRASIPGLDEYHLRVETSNANRNGDQMTRIRGSECAMLWITRV